MSLLPVRPAPRAVTFIVAGLTLLTACAGCGGARAITTPAPAPVVILHPGRTPQGAAIPAAPVATTAGYVLPNWPTRRKQPPISV